MAQTPVSFSYFPQLPAELRLKVWSLATPLPRIIELTWNSKAHAICSRTAPAAILQACRESRHELIGSYGPLRFGEGSTVILVNFQHDIIFFGPGCNHVVTSGKTSPWVRMNPKMIRDITASDSLRHLRITAFDSGFLNSFEKSDEAFRLSEICKNMESLSDVFVVRTEDWEERRDKVHCGNGVKFVEAGRDVWISKEYFSTCRALSLARNHFEENAKIMGLEALKSSPTSNILPFQNSSTKLLLKRLFTHHHYIS
jgi:hypothetical protein